MAGMLAEHLLCTAPLHPTISCSLLFTLLGSHINPRSGWNYPNLHIKPSRPGEAK